MAHMRPLRSPPFGSRSVTRSVIVGLLALTAAGCPAVEDDAGPGPGGKADDPFATSRRIEVLLTAPHCDSCSQADKDFLRQRSPIIAKVIGLIDGATSSLDVAQFTFSVKEIEAALVRAHQRGVTVRLAINHGQREGDNVANRLKAIGIEVRFVEGKVFGGERPPGLQHAKFVIADGTTLLSGSNNWSSTGTTINNENTMVFESSTDDPLISGFGCHFEAMWEAEIESAGACSNSVVAFTPSTAPIAMLKEEIRAAEHSVDVLMHHLLFKDLVKVLAQAAERGVLVRVVANHGDESEHTGTQWDRLRAAGGEIRYKTVNADAFQFMHHKLAIVDNLTLLNGSGNWSGSAFFNNYENFIRLSHPDVVRPFRGLFSRLWMWSLSIESRATQMTAAEQHTATTQVFFGNLHAHIAAIENGQKLDDGKPMRRDTSGTEETIDAGGNLTAATRFAYEYARDLGEMDFLALSPHVKDDRAEDGSDQANLSRAGFDELLSVAADVSDESEGSFVAIPAVEWNTNSAGNHINIFGSRVLAKTVRDRFDTMWNEFLPSRAFAGDSPTVQLNHPRTMRRQDVSLKGSWDQIFGVNLLEIPTGGERNKKFNDFGLDDFPPLADVRQDWLLGTEMPSETVVAQTMEKLRAAAAPFARLMEVTIGRGNELGDDIAVNPSLSADPSTGELVRFTKVHSDWDHYLLSGWRLAPTAPHDNHMANWGTGHTSRTAIAAARLSERALLDAIDRRAVFASEDENLSVRFYADELTSMGSVHRIAGPGAVDLRAALSDPDYNGEYAVNFVVGTVGESQVRVIDGGSGLSGSFPLTIELESGVHFVYVEALEVDANRMAWSAPIWIEVL